MQLIKTVSCLLAGALALTFVSCEKEDKTISVEKIAFNVDTFCGADSHAGVDNHSG